MTMLEIERQVKPEERIVINVEEFYKYLDSIFDNSKEEDKRYLENVFGDLTDYVYEKESSEWNFRKACYEYYIFKKEVIEYILKMEIKFSLANKLINYIGKN